MNIIISPEADDDYEWFVKNNRKLAFRIVKIINSIKQTPFYGIGKPEPLKHNLSGLWSRRIDKQNRIFYRFINNDTIEIVRCKGHYGDK